LGSLRRIGAGNRIRPETRIFGSKGDVTDWAVKASFAERHRGLRMLLQGMPDPQQRLTWMVERSRTRVPVSVDLRTEDRRVPGCAARLWLVGGVQNGLCSFACDSDSAILKAVAGLLCELYDALSAEEVVASEPTFLGDCGLLVHFTENRKRTIAKVREAIRAFAAAQVPDPGKPGSLQ